MTVPTRSSYNPNGIAFPRSHAQIQPHSQRLALTSRQLIQAGTVTRRIALLRKLRHQHGLIMVRTVIRICGPELSGRERHL